MTSNPYDPSDQSPDPTGQPPNQPVPDQPYGSSYGSNPYGTSDPSAQPPQGQGSSGAPGQGYPQHQGQGMSPSPAQAPLSQNDERLWATLAHAGIPIVGFVGPLIVFLVFKDRSHWLKESSTEALNFSILYSIAQLIGSILTPVLIGLAILPVVFVVGVVFCILAAIASNKGEQYKYPVNWRIVK